MPFTYARFREELAKHAVYLIPQSHEGHEEESFVFFAPLWETQAQWLNR
jgi:hypothetical protein